MAAGTHMSMWMRVALRAPFAHLLEPEQRPAAVRVDQVLALGVAVLVAEHGTPAGVRDATAPRPDPDPRYGAFQPGAA